MPEQAINLHTTRTSIWHAKSAKLKDAPRSTIYAEPHMVYAPSRTAGENQMVSTSILSLPIAECISA